MQVSFLTFFVLAQLPLDDQAKLAPVVTALVDTALTKRVLAAMTPKQVHLDA